MHDVMNFMNHWSGVDHLRVSGLALVPHLHDGAPVVAVGAVCHVLHTAVRKGDLSVTVVSRAHQRLALPGILRQCCPLRPRPCAR